MCFQCSAKLARALCAAPYRQVVTFSGLLLAFETPAEPHAVIVTEEGPFAWFKLQDGPESARRQGPSVVG